ncbi:NUMOD4 domain-containing protein [Chitinophaga sp. 30R24]|uniref:NUMOD4 domain-containing protein n=1 Tax=Chitinophaga sp. 30R24 TaxID=3248838 RepID=UPI003B91A27F
MTTLENQWPYQNKSLKDMKGEIWREVPGFDGDLIVSNYGRVKVLPRFIVHRNAPDGFWTKERIKVQFVPSGIIGKTDHGMLLPIQKKIHLFAKRLAISTGIHLFCK